MISAVTSTPKPITTTVDQKLTCTIGGLDQGYLVTITWKEPGGTVISTSDINNYEMTQGTVDETGRQEAVLTIKTAKLVTFISASSVTYKCSVRSTQYDASPISTDIDVVADLPASGEESVMTNLRLPLSLNSLCLVFPSSKRKVGEITKKSFIL